MGSFTRPYKIPKHKLLSGNSLNLEYHSFHTATEFGQKQRTLYCTGKGTAL